MIRTISTSLRRRSLAIFSFTLLILISGCRSDWIDTDVENRIGQTVRELEVSYPTASFGMNNLASGQSMHYRFQVRGTGHLHVQYTTADGKTFQSDGTTLAEHQSGHITIRLLSEGKTMFLPTIQPASTSAAP